MTTALGGRHYGGAWQEFRAYIAYRLVWWAMSVHPEATFDLAKDLAAIHGRRLP